MPQQTLKNHARLDPAFHFTLVPLLWVILISSVVLWFRQHSFARGIGICMALAMFWIAFLTRIYALKAQDRTIRLEERLRLQRLGHDVPGLSTKQYVALRFASDSEVLALAERSSHEQLQPKQIKEAIQSWRPDYDRI